MNAIWCWEKRQDRRDGKKDEKEEKERKGRHPRSGTYFWYTFWVLLTWRRDTFHLTDKNWGRNSIQGIPVSNKKREKSKKVNRNKCMKEVKNGFEKLGVKKDWNRQMKTAEREREGEEWRQQGRSEEQFSWVIHWIIMNTIQFIGSPLANHICDVWCLDQIFLNECKGKRGRRMRWGKSKDWEVEEWKRGREMMTQ